MALPFLLHQQKIVRFSSISAALCPRRSLVVCLSLVLVLAFLGPVGCGQGSEDHGPHSAANLEPPRHILLISLDALRADHLGCYGYSRPTSPAMDSLAAEGVLFSRAQAPRGQTWPSLTSLLTGYYPLEHGVRDNSIHPGDQLQMLPEYLRASGFRTAAFLANFGDAIRSKETIGLDHLARSDVSSTTPQNLWDDNMTDKAVSWITENRDRPTFTWVHLMNPHRPYDPPAADRELLLQDDEYDGWLDDRVSLSDMNKGIREGRIPVSEEQFDEFVHSRYYMPWLAVDYLELMQKQDWHLTIDQLLDLIVLQRVDLSAEDLAFIISRYDAEVRSADRCVSRLLETVEKLGLQKDTLVILTSDHGDELYDHNHYFFHSSSIYQGVLHVPLVLRWPGRIEPATTVDSLVQLIDLLPTILEAAGLPQPAGLSGSSLLPLLQRESEAPDTLAFAELFHRLPPEQQAGPPMDGVYAVRDTRWKLVLNPSGICPLRVSLAYRPDSSDPSAREELYDLERDPGEQQNLLTLTRTNLKETALEASGGEALDAAEYLLEANLACKRLSSELTRWLQRQEVAAGVEEARRVSDEVRQRLAALGYVEADPLPPGPPILTEKPTGREEMIRTALQLTREPPAPGEKRPEDWTERAQDLTRRGEAQLIELLSDHPAPQQTADPPER